ncbi:MAG: glycosyltransferase family 4 protein [Waddliaceae bacterium]
MEFAINGSCLEGSRTGVGRYMENLLNVWVERYPHHRYHVFFRREVPRHSYVKHNSVTTEIVSCPDWLNFGPLWENTFLVKSIRCNGMPDVFFSPSYTLPLVRVGKRHVVTMFDLSYLAHPEWFPPKTRMMYKIITPLSVLRADLILTGSKASRREILKYFEMPEGKVQVTYPGVDPIFMERKNSHEEKRLSFTRKYRLQGKVVLHVGLLANRRNVPALIQAFADLKRRWREESTLFIIGQNRSYPYFDVSEIAKKSGMSDRIRWVDYLSEEELAMAYECADVFVYPSLYEGFGLPPLEAMATGVPVITSNLSSLPEVVGEVALLLEDPRDPLEIRDALETVLSDSHRRKEMIAHGKRRAQTFSWERCAIETMDHIEKGFYERD